MAATKIEKHKTENARMQMPGTRLGDTIYRLRSGQAPYHFILCGWKQRQSFSRNHSILDKHSVVRLKPRDMCFTLLSTGFSSSSESQRRAWIISRAALAPEAPVRPLPGWVAEPQRKRLRMGVL